MKILHLSDIHFKVKYSDSSTQYLQMLQSMQHPQLKLTHLIDLLKNRGIEYDYVVITGDLCDDGTVEDYQQLKILLDSLLAVPYFVALGNHDIKENFYKGFLNQEYNRPYCKVFNLENFSIISFDNSQYGLSNGYIDKERLNWLKETYRKLNNEPALLMMHHHLIKRQADIPALEAPKAFRQILCDNPTMGILTGHTHHQFADYYQGIPYFTADAIAFAGQDMSDGKVRFDENYGANIYTIKDRKIINNTVYSLYTGKIIKEVQF